MFFSSFLLQTNFLMKILQELFSNFKININAGHKPREIAMKIYIFKHFYGNCLIITLGVLDRVEYKKIFLKVKSSYFLY
jgi:hypothetical protein